MLGRYKERRLYRGDTLIEVLIAVTVFSLVAVGGLSVMNSGAATAQRSLEITLVRQEIDAQAEAIRFLNASYVSSYVKGLLKSSYTGQAATWLNLPTNTFVSDFGVDGNNKCPTPPANSFVINTRTLQAQLISSTSADAGHSITYAKVNFDDTANTQKITSVDGLWVEAIRGGSTDNTDYLDFNIRACWDSLGQATPVTLGTIVRLYEPYDK